MSIYTGPVFDMARKRFVMIADHLEIPEDERDRLLYPKRAVTVSVPVHRDDGTTAVYQGYRVQHHLTMGPTKGGTRFSANLDIGEVAALAIWMSWKFALVGLPYGEHVSHRMAAMAAGVEKVFAAKKIRGLFP